MKDPKDVELDEAPTVDAGQQATTAATEQSEDLPENGEGTE